MAQPVQLVRQVNISRGTAQTLLLFCRTSTHPLLANIFVLCVICTCRRAIVDIKATSKRAHVLDLGAGTGLLSMLAVR